MKATKTTGTEARAVAIANDVHTARQAGVAALVPPATEPLKASPVSVLGKLLDKTIDVLGGGEVELPPLQPTGAGQLERVPPDVGVRFVTLAQFVGAAGEQFPALQSYKLDPALLTTNDGIVEAQAIVQGLGSDQEVIAALRQPAPGPAPEEIEEDDVPPEDTGEED